MKKTILPFFIVLSILMISGCQSTEERERAEYDKAMNDLDELIAEQDSFSVANETQDTFGSESTSANLYITRSGDYAACVSREDLDKIISYAVEDDTEAIEALLRSKRCISMNGGIEVYLESAGALTSVVEIRPKGQEGTVWTIREALIKK